MADERKGALPPMIEAARLYEKVSAKGVAYYVGRLGGLKVLVLPKKADDAGEHSHVLMVTAPTGRDGGR